MVYRGTQLDLEKPVAIKVLLQSNYSDSEARARFRREATLASKLIHPSIAQVFDFGLEGETPFLVMEYVEGKELSEIIGEEGAFSPSRALTLMRQLASVLQEAHRNQLVHRDLKPSNIRLMRYTATGPIFLKVLDFGIAKQVGSIDGKLTATGAIVGTPLYMSPEQAGLEVGQIDCRADQYSAGIIFYELLTGHPPFLAESLHALLMHHISKPPPPLPARFPKPLREVVMRMLAKQPADRFADPAELDAALARCEEACAGLPALRSDETVSPPLLPRRLWLSAGLLLSLLLLLVGALALRSQRAGTAPASPPVPTGAAQSVASAGGSPGSTGPSPTPASSPANGPAPASPGADPSRPAPVVRRKPGPAGASAPKPAQGTKSPTVSKPPPRPQDPDHELYQVPVLH